MKNLIKMTAVLATIILANQSSFAQSCAEDVECQQNKIEAMATTSSSTDSLIADIKMLQSKFSTLVTIADSEHEYKGSARGLGYTEELETEAMSLSRSKNASDKSIRGRTRAEIQQDVNYIKQSLAADAEASAALGSK